MLNQIVTHSLIIRSLLFLLSSHLKKRIHDELRKMYRLMANI